MQHIADEGCAEIVEDLAGPEFLSDVRRAHRAYGHALLGFIGYERGTLREGVRSLKAAMELDPTDADVHFFLGISLIAAGQPDEAYRLSQRVVGTDPHSPLAGMLAGVTTWFVGRPMEGLESQERSLELEPESFIHRWTLAYHYLLVGRTADAARQADWLNEHAPQLPYTAQMRALVAAAEGRPNDALALITPVDIRVLDGHHLFHLPLQFLEVIFAEQAFVAPGQIRPVLDQVELL